MRTEAQKRADKKYRDDKISTLGATIPKDIALDFKKICLAYGITVNQAIRAYAEMVNAGNEKALEILQSGTNSDTL